MLTNLFAHLLMAYGIPPKRWANTQTLKIDDEGQGDVPSRFCRIYANRTDPNIGAVTLTLENAPSDPDVAGLVANLDGTVTASPLGTSITLGLFGSDDAPSVRRLAEAIKRLTSRRRTRDYTNSDWRWVVPRTVKSLETFAKHLAAYKEPRPTTTST